MCLPSSKEFKHTIKLLFVIHISDIAYVSCEAVEFGLMYAWKNKKLKQDYVKRSFMENMCYSLLWQLVDVSSCMFMSDMLSSFYSSIVG